MLRALKKCAPLTDADWSIYIQRNGDNFRLRQLQLRQQDGRPRGKPFPDAGRGRRTPRRLWPSGALGRCPGYRLYGSLTRAPTPAADADSGRGRR